ncbi:hypothetical protein J4209_04545 [Candidatus Woesearchaeota archaeon]|nr:hypothetical protein [Candidatus Woesearchaeota archaeon]
MEQKNNDIALVVIDAVLPGVEEDKDIALSRIQKLIDEGVPRLKDAGLNTQIYEFFLMESGLNHDGAKINRSVRSDYKINDVPYELILVGGALWSKHYDAFVSLLQQSRKAGKTPKINLPFDCISAFECKHDQGDNWTEGILASPDMPVFDNYIKAIREYASSAYLIERDGKATESSLITTLKIWDGWKSMVGYLTAKKSGS